MNLSLTVAAWTLNTTVIDGGVVVFVVLETNVTVPVYDPGSMAPATAFAWKLTVAGKGVVVPAVAADGVTVSQLGAVPTAKAIEATEELRVRATEVPGPPPRVYDTLTGFGEPLAAVRLE